jgi:predicted nuclease of predicted toxin-antitoxin system
MIPSGARLLTDENVHPEVVAFLRDRGCEVLDVKEQERAGASDRELVHLAAEEQRMILTHDRDFGRLLMAQEQQFPAGIIYLRPGHIDPSFTIGTLRVLAEYERPDSPFIVVAEREKETVRVRTRIIGND